MRHNKAINHLGRKSGHRKALMSNMASSLILHKRITTTVAKAKALKSYAEPLITKSKEDTTHSRRVVFSYLKDKNAVAELFRTIAPKIADRPGGYLRVLHLGFRQGDAADMALIDEFDSDLLTVIALCVAVPCVWFLVHLILLHWFDYIFGTHNRLAIVDRIYLGYHLLYSPIIYVMFVMFVIADLPRIMIAILLFVFFIITQILLVYSIFRIFSNNKGSIYVILLYLCALEIAPLAVIYAKLGM